MRLNFSGIFALRNNIYGVDLDQKAIDITAFTLMVQVYDELKDGARCPTMIGENLKVILWFLLLCQRKEMNLLQGMSL